MNGQHPVDKSFSADEQDPMVQAVLADFRASAHAWSNAAYSNRAMVISPARPRAVWSRSLAWSLSVILTAGAATTSVYQYRHYEQARQAAAQRQAEHQRQLALEQRAREVDDLLAKVDRDVSRQVPSAMEPLASLMAEDDTQ